MDDVFLYSERIRQSRALKKAWVFKKTNESSKIKNKDKKDEGCTDEGSIR